MKQLLKQLLIPFFLLSFPFTANSTVENTAFFSAGEIEFPGFLYFSCNVENPVDNCGAGSNYDTDSLKIETSSISELSNSLFTIEGLSTLDGKSYFHTINWQANFSFSVDQITEEYFTGKNIKTEMIYRSTGLPIIDEGDDLIRITSAEVFSGSFVVELGENSAISTNNYFRFRLTPVPLPLSFWLFSSSLVTLGFCRRKINS